MVKPERCLRALLTPRARIEAVGICGGILRFARVKPEKMWCRKAVAILLKKIVPKQGDAA
jgi:hypothetical protein